MASIITHLPPDQFRARGYRTVPTPFFLLKIKKYPGDRARIGVVAGVSVHKTAVKRNFWKRQVRAAIAPHAPAGSDILIIALPAINRLTKKQFKEEFLKALGAAHLK